MKNFIYLLLLFTTVSQAQSNRKSIYPVILVHGLNSSDATWLKLMQQYQGSNYNVSISGSRAGSGSRIDFMLNADNDLSKATTNFKYQVGQYNYGDVVDMQSYINPDNDVFVMNFDNGNLSNQSAIAKQGYALGIAIQKILAATKAEKVILVGHSMGGLAIREYLQNSRFLFYANNYIHKVYRVVTIGTPHGGSNLGTGGFNVANWWGLNERSEAVRDLRTTHTASGKKGIYLWGGLERDATYGVFGDKYYNTDINCNGITDEIAGINAAKSQFLPTDIYYNCIIGSLSATADNDLIVTTFSQNINNFVQKNTNGFLGPISDILTIPNVVHDKETEQAFKIIKLAMITINVPIKIGNYYVFLTGGPSPDGSQTWGYATYYFDITERGKLDLTYITPTGVKPRMELRENFGSGFAHQTDGGSITLEKGNYYLKLVGEMPFDQYATAKILMSFKPDAVNNGQNLNVSSVYPNPTHGFVNIKTETKPQTIECFDMIGQRIDFDQIGNGIDIKKKGLVFVRIDTQTFRVLVQ